MRNALLEAKTGMVVGGWRYPILGYSAHLGISRKVSLVVHDANDCIVHNQANFLRNLEISRHDYFNY